LCSTTPGLRALEHQRRDEYSPTRDRRHHPALWDGPPGPASDPGPLLLPEPLHCSEVEPLQRPVEIVAVQGGRGIVGEIMALETRTRALPPTARAGYAAPVRRAR
jgi:hypothetical protein